MSLPVQWLPEAAREVRGARRRYALVNQKTVQKFSEEMKLAEARIAAMPQASSPGELGTRFVVLRTFPHVIHFRFNAERVEILAVAHARRRPGYWHSRLS
jgi:plasmid stabilization system protein ParE